MKRTVIAASVLALVAAIGVSSSQAQGGDPPSKVTGGSTFLDIGADGMSGHGFGIEIGRFEC